MIGIGVEEEDRKHTWMDDAESVSVPMTTHDSINTDFEWSSISRDSDVR